MSASILEPAATGFASPQEELLAAWQTSSSYRPSSWISSCCVPPLNSATISRRHPQAGSCWRTNWRIPFSSTACRNPPATSRWIPRASTVTWSAKPRVYRTQSCSGVRRQARLLRRAAALDPCCRARTKTPKPHSRMRRLKKTKRTRTMGYPWRKTRSWEKPEWSGFPSLMPTPA
jgi:hypothetical protein